MAQGGWAEKVSRFQLIAPVPPMQRPSDPARALDSLNHRIIGCELCPRLANHRRKVAREKRRMFLDWEYWGNPVPGFGDPEAELLILGLAPAAHGANRTGRMFTGDQSGNFLFQGLYKAGFASQAESRSRDDGLRLRNCYVTASLRCCPPMNKPLPTELKNCQRYLEAELDLLGRVRTVLALGRIAFDCYLRVIADRLPGLELPPRSALPFAHGGSYQLPGGLPRLFASYHPSQQNTQTGRLTQAMFQNVLQKVQRFLAIEKQPG